MCDVLDGRLTLDDVEGVVAECMSKAEDIKQQLIVLETPPAGWCVWGGGVVTGWGGRGASLETPPAGGGRESLGGKQYEGCHRRRHLLAGVWGGIGGEGVTRGGM